MVNEKLTDAQACPDCGATQGYRTTGISIMNPVGCEEIVSPVRCATCGRHYWEILEDCWFHGGQRSTRRIPAKLADVVARHWDPAGSKLCSCPDHQFMRNVLYARFTGPAKGEPWVTQAEVRAALGPDSAARLDPLFVLVDRVHGGQVRDDGMPYLEEHVFPVTRDVVEYLTPRRPSDVEMGAAAALTHDVLEDIDWSDPPLSVEEARQTMGPALESLAFVLAKSTLPADLDGAAKEAGYVARLQEAPGIVRIVKVFDRINNLRCVHRSPGKALEYRAESRRDYLPLAVAQDPELGGRMAAAIGC